jgi:hypothetical protein
MVAIQQKGLAFRQAIPMARVAYIIERDLSTLPKALNELIGPDSLAVERRAYRAYCLGDALGPEAPLPFLREVDRILDGPPQERRPAVHVNPGERAAR